MRALNYYHLCGLFTLFLVVTRQLLIAAEQATEYNMLHRKNESNSFLDNYKKYTILPLNDTHEIIFAKLNRSYAKYLRGEMRKVGGIVQKNNFAILDQGFYSDSKADENFIANAMLNSSVFVSGAPSRCNCTMENVALIVADSYPKPMSIFKGVKTKITMTNNSHVVATPGPTHFAHVTASILGNNYGAVVGTTRNVEWIPVFTSGGSAYDSDIIAMLIKARDIAITNNLKGKRTVVNLSISGGFNNEIITAASKELTKVAIFVKSSGNEGTDTRCGRYWNNPEIFNIGATKLNNGTQLAYFSNYGWCVDMYAQGEYRSYNGEIIHGTSFAAPIVASWAICYANKYPNLSNEKITSSILAKTKKVLMTTSTGAGTYVNLMPKDQVCNIHIKKSVIFNATTTHQNTPTNWYPTAQHWLCVRYNVSTVQGAALMWLRGDNETTLVQIGARRADGDYAHIIKQDSEILNATITSNRIIDKKVEIQITQKALELVVAFNNTRLVSVKLQQEMREVSPSGLEVRYRRALQC